MVYSVNPACVLHWVSFNDEYVVFDETSGQTFQLDLLRAFVLNFLGTECCSFEAILTEASAVSSVEDIPTLSELLKTVLNELCVHGLVEESVE